MTMSEQLKQAIELLSSIAGSANDHEKDSDLDGGGTGTRSARQTPYTTGSRPGGQGATSACSRALEAVRSVRERLQNNSGPSTSSELGTAAAEQRSNFYPYRPSAGKGKSWAVKLVCLSQQNASRVPCSAWERNLLIGAGLGEKKAVIPNIDCSPGEFDRFLKSVFPKLDGCGGFEMMRCVPNTKSLEIISPAISQSPKLLKSVIGNGRVFIRPIQKNLDVDSSQKASELREKCMYCDAPIAVSELREHIAVCRWKKSSLEKGLYSSSESDDGLGSPLPKKLRSQSPISVSSDSEDVTATEGEMVQHALNLSTQVAPPTEPSSSGQLIQQLYKSVKDEVTTLTVTRECVLQDALSIVKRASFDFAKSITVEFLGEDGADGGGLRREFWCLVGRAIKNSLCEGNEERLVLRHDAQALQERKFVHVGGLIAMSLLQDGSGIPFLAPPVFQYLCGTSPDALDICTDDAPSPGIRMLVQSIERANDDSTLQEVCTCPTGMDIIVDSGYSKPVASIQMNERDGLIRGILLDCVIYRIKAVLDQLKEGLQVLGIGESMRKYPHLLKPFFVAGLRPPLSADMIKSMIGPIHFSENGSSELVKERSTYMLFLDFMRNVEDGEHQLGLGQVLSFFTGSDYPPPLGFDVKITINFDANASLPTASTCALHLTLPTIYYNKKQDFHKAMVFAMSNHGGFGKC